MEVKFLGKHVTTDNEGRPINGRTTYVYSLTTEEEASLCEAKFQIPVREINFSAQLVADGSCLNMDVPGETDKLAGFLLEAIKKA